MYEFATTKSSTHSKDKNISWRSEPIKLSEERYKINVNRARFPFCIVWTPLPCITQLIPFIGHTGIGDSRGVLHDFAGPYTVTIDDLAFGETHKFVRLVDLEKEGVTPEQFDQALKQADICYRKRMHNIFCDNCHSHVARALNILKFKGRTNYTMIDVWWMCLANSSYVSLSHVFWTYVLWILVALIWGLVQVLS